MEETVEANGADGANATDGADDTDAGRRRRAGARRLLTVLAGWLLLTAAPSLADEALVSWRQVLLKIDDPGPRLRVDVDGRVEVHVPVFLRGAGDYAFTLDPGELGELRVDLARLAGLDAEGLRAERNRRLREIAAVGDVPTRTGSALSLFEIDGVGRVAWRGLTFEASWVGDPRLARLAALEQRFWAWTRDARRRPLQGPAQGPKTPLEFEP